MAESSAAAEKFRESHRARAGKAAQIDTSQVKGEPGTGYEGPEGGAFRCGNCEYFRDGSCGQQTMMERSRRPRTEDGRVRVDPNGCCEYVDRKG